MEIRVMLTGSHDDMKLIEAEGRLDDWCNDNPDWLAKTSGKENVVSATLHMDEDTPHIHAPVIPIVTGKRREKKRRLPIWKPACNNSNRIMNPYKAQEDLNAINKYFPMMPEQMRVAGYANKSG